MVWLKKDSWSTGKEERLMERAEIWVLRVDDHFPHNFHKSYLMSETKSLAQYDTQDKDI